MSVLLASDNLYLHFVQFSCIELVVLCFIQFNCTDECPEYAEYTYTKQMKDGGTTTLCVAENYNALGFVASLIVYILCPLQYCN